MTPLLGRPLSDYIFVDPDDAAAVEQAVIGGATLVEKQIVVLERANAALTAIESIQCAGGRCD